MTLLYGRGATVHQAIEPVAWTVRELVLVHSFLGETRHEVLGRWPLRG
jgi:2'-5' RNA ligase